MTNKENMRFQTFLAATLVIAMTASRNSTALETSAESNTTVVLVSEVEWQQLNPDRGDASPKAATLWGDRNGTEPTGFLVKFTDGFSSPPHLHNVTYRGIVIGGGMHNDDPDASPMWMPPGSFWTQPKGAAHITAARGSTVAYIEIEEGPYLVKPTEEAFDSGERPVNVDRSNLVWLDASDTTWIHQPENSVTSTAQVAFLWNTSPDEQKNGVLVKLPSGFCGEVRSVGKTLRGILIEGKCHVGSPAAQEAKQLTPGSYFSSYGAAAHQVSCDAKQGCLIYVRSEGKVQIITDSPTQ